MPKNQKDPMSTDAATTTSIETETPVAIATLTRRRRSQRSFPAAPFEESLSFARQVFDFGSGEPVRRLSFFDHIGRSPESGSSRQAITNSNKYGIIRGGYQADILELTQEGVRAVDPSIPARDQARERIKLSVENIEVFSKIHDKFSGRTLPVKAALVDSAKEFGVSNEDAEECIETLLLNLRFAGLLTILSGAERFVSKEHALDQLPSSNTAISQPPASPSRPNAVITAEQAHYESTCFYITPIGSPESEQRKHSDLFLGSFVEPALTSFGLSVIRADGIDKPGIITKQVIEHIVKSRLVIADLSFHNPNVFYELAIRHMMRLPIVQIIRKADFIPFDVNQARTIVIDTTDIYSLVPKITSYQSEISSQVRRALENPETAETPISIYFPDIRVSI
jgi:hypothetical protein